MQPQMANSPGMQAPPQMPPQPMLVPEAIALLKSDIKRTFAVDIETDSTIQPDEQAEKEARVEMLTGVSAFMQQALPAAQAVPELAPMIGEMLLFTFRTFKAGRQLEATIEEMVDQARNAPPQPKTDPEAEKAKAELQMQAEKAKQDAQIRQAELAQKGEIAQAEMQQKAQQSEREMALKSRMADREFALKERQMTMEMQLKQAQSETDTMLKRETAANDMAVKRETAAAAKRPPVNLQMTDDGQFKQLEGAMTESTKATQQTMQALIKGQQDSSRLLAEAAAMIAQAAKEMSRPRRTRALRDDAGTLIGAESEVV